MGDFIIAPDRGHTAAAHADGGNPDNTSPVADSSLSAAVGRSRLDKKEAVRSPAVSEPVTTVHAFTYPKQTLTHKFPDGILREEHASKR